MRYRGTYNEARAAGQFAAGLPQEHLKNVELMKSATMDSQQTNPQTPAPTRMDSYASTPADGSVHRDGWGQGLSPAEPTQLVFEGVDQEEKGKPNQEEEDKQKEKEKDKPEDGGVKATEVAETPATEAPDNKQDEVEVPPPAPPSPKAPPAPTQPTPKQKAPSKPLYQNGSYWRTSSTQSHIYALFVCRFSSICYDRVEIGSNATLTVAKLLLDFLIFSNNGVEATWL